jgi:alpha-glucosidase
MESQSGDPASMLELYRSALRLRHTESALGDGPLSWLPEQPSGVLAFTRGSGFACVVNLSGSPVPLPPHTEVLLTSGPLAGTQLPPDTAAWLHQETTPSSS